MCIYYTYQWVSSKTCVLSNALSGFEVFSVIFNHDEAIFKKKFLSSLYLPTLSVTDHKWRTMSVQDRGPQQDGGPNLVNIEVMRNHSELFRAECLKLISETDKQCRRMQNDRNMQLGKRLRNQLDCVAKRMML